MTSTLRRRKEGGHWHWWLDAPPHVLLRAKRVFRRVQASARHIILRETPEVCRDLLWFLDRYPASITPADLRRLKAGAKAHVEQEHFIEQILAEGAARSPRRYEMALPPRDYQKTAAELVLGTGGLLLADDLGIGKTVSAICMLTEPATLPALVVAAPALAWQWEAEIHRFLPQLRTHILKSTSPYDLRAVPRSKELGPLPDVIIASYHKLAGWHDVLAKLCRSVVYDEVQELRHTGSGRYEAAKHISEAVSYRLGLSATPIYNYGAEIYNVINQLRPDALGSRSEFLTEWCANDALREPKIFGAYVRQEGLMLRRTRQEVARELPAFTKIVHTVESDDEAIDDVAGPAAELAKLLLRGSGEKGAMFRAAEELSMRLRQATGLGKAPYVADFVRLLVESGESVLLFGWHRAVYGIWLERLKDLAPAMFTGTESPREKEEAKRRFTSGETKILIMSLRAGAGVDGLQHVCHTVVHGELDWSPGVHEQDDGRVFRDGQTQPVFSYYLVAGEGSDPVVADVLGLKRSQIEGIRDPDADLIEALGTGHGNIRRLAKAFLEQRGIPLPEPQTPKSPIEGDPAPCLLRESRSPASTPAPTWTRSAGSRSSTRGSSGGSCWARMPPAAWASTSPATPACPRSDRSWRCSARIRA